MIAFCANVMPTAPPRACAPGAARRSRNWASRCAGPAARRGESPTEPAAPEPGSKASHTAVAIRSSAAVPTGPGTYDDAGRGVTQDFARPAASAGRKTTAPSASSAARLGAHSTAGVTLCARLPAAVCAARSPRSTACRAAAGASQRRRSASPPSGRAPSASGATQRGAPKASVSIAKCLPVAPRAVRVAHIVPTPARPSATWRCSGRRRSP